METALLVAVGRAALAGHKAAPQSEDEAKARLAALSPPAPVDRELSAEFWRRRREHEEPAQLDELLRWNAEAYALGVGPSKEWRGC